MQIKLYLVHCGFYESELFDGIYEFHVNFFIAASTFEEAIKKTKALPEFQRQRMHVDGLQEVMAVNGYRLYLNEDTKLEGKTVFTSKKHRDLAPKTAANS